jgi:hypothetical protein
MRGGDIAALLLVAIVVDLSVSGEWSAIKVCHILGEQRKSHTAPRWLRGCSRVLAILRQFGFMSLLTAIVPQLVAHRGSASIEIFSNGVAIIVLLEVDNAIYVRTLDPCRDTRLC